MTDLVLAGTVTVGGTDVSAEVTLITIKGTVADVQIPATLTQPNSHAGGSPKYMAQIDYLSDDANSGLLHPLLYAAMSTASGELVVVARLRAGIESPTNPQWTFTIVAPGADVGGPAEGLSTGSISATMTGAPVLLEA